jgi:hypothetical protein
MAQETEQNQTTTREPGPYPFGGEEIWQQFLNQYFGDEESGTPGLLDLLQDNAREARGQYGQLWQNTLQPAYQSYRQDLNQAMRSGDRFQNRMAPFMNDVTRQLATSARNRVPVNIGGHTFQLAPQGGVNLAQKRYAMGRDVATPLFEFEAQQQPRIASNLLQSKTEPALQSFQHRMNNMPGQVQADYISGELLPLATQIQGMRYGIPTTSRQGSSTSEESLGLLGQIGQWGGLIGDLGNIFDVDWGAAVDYGSDLIGNLFGDGGFDYGHIPGIT